MIPGLPTARPRRALVFASFGATAFLVAAQPQQQTSRFYNVRLGHLLGIGVGVGAVLLLGAADAPPVFVEKQLPAVRVWASVLAVAVTLLVAAPLKTASFATVARPSRLLHTWPSM